MRGERHFRGGLKPPLIRLFELALSLTQYYILAHFFASAYD